MSSSVVQANPVVREKARSSRVPAGESRRVFPRSGCVSLPPLGRAIALLDGGRPKEADETITAALVEDGCNADLWLAAGIARLRRGAIGPARAAFRMCAWLSDDTAARGLAALLDDRSFRCAVPYPASVSGVSRPECSAHSQ